MLKCSMHYRQVILDSYLLYEKLEVEEVRRRIQSCVNGLCFHSL